MKTKQIILALVAGAMLMTSCNSPMEKRIDASIQEVMQQYECVGMTAVILKDGEVIYDKAFGYKDLDTKEPLSTSHMMRIASISKSFTATGLMKQVEKGIISLDDDISDLIGFQIRNPHHPEVPITLRMVLSHTASIRDQENYSTLDHLNPAISGDCMASFYEYKPGEGYNYSNLGLNLAGTILEKVTNVRFDQYVRDSIILPLGLEGGHNVDMLDSSRIASLYNYRNGAYVKSAAYGSVAHRLDNYTMGYSAPMFSPTGGVKISTQDLAQYMKMHMNYGELNGVRIISEESAKTMQTPVWMIQNIHEWEDQYGLCLKEFVDFIDDPQYNTPGNYLVGHTGDAYGLRSIMIWSPTEGWGIAAMTNGYIYNKDMDILKPLVNGIVKAMK